MTRAEGRPCPADGALAARDAALCCACAASRFRDLIPVVEDARAGFALGAAPIGTGACSEVYRAQRAGGCPRSADGCALAVKVISKGKLARAELALLAREVRVMRALDHPAIVRLADAVQDARYVCLVSELCPHGDLWEHTRRGGPLAEHEARSVSGQLVGALGHMHARSVAHRDVKSENVVIRELGADGSVGTVLLADFGAAKYYGPQETGAAACPSGSGCCQCPACRGAPGAAAAGYTLCSPRGTLQFAPPEVLEGVITMGPHPRRVRGWEMEAQDVWSFGCCMFQALCAAAPFIAAGWQRPQDPRDEASQLAGMVCVSPEELWCGRAVPNQCRVFVDALLRHEPEDRPRFAVIAQHPFLLGSPLRCPEQAAPPSGDTLDISPSRSEGASWSPKRRRVNGGAAAPGDPVGLSHP